MGSPSRDDRVARHRHHILNQSSKELVANGVFSQDDFEGLRSLLDQIKFNESRDGLREGVKQFLEDRRRREREDPLRLHVNLSRPPVVVVNVSGTLGDHSEAERLIEEQVMGPVRETAHPFWENNMRVVLDLRMLRGARDWTTEALLYRWGRYLNARCSEGGCVAVVLPRDAGTRTVLEAKAAQINLAWQIMPDTRLGVLERARDIAPFLEG